MSEIRKYTLKELEEVVICTVGEHNSKTGDEFPMSRKMARKIARELRDLLMGKTVLG